MADTPSHVSKNPRHFLMSNILVGLGTLLSRITGFGKILALAYAIGLSGLSDVYNTANTTPNIIYELMLGGILSATLLPSFVRAFKDNDNQAISAIISVVIVLLAGLTILMVVCAPLIMSLYSVTRQDSPQEFYEVGVILIRLFMPQIFFYGLIAIGTALLNAQHKFSLPAYAPVLNNLIVIAILMALPSLFGQDINLQNAAENQQLVLFLGIGTTAGIVLSSLILIPSLMKSGIQFTFLPRWRHPAVQTVLKMSGWTLGYVICNQIALLIITLAALHEEGWLTAYQMAFVFFLLPHGLLAMTITTTFMPKIAHFAAINDWNGYVDKMMLGIKLLILLILPASVGYILIERPLLTTLLEHGQFTTKDASLTGDVLAMFAIGLLPFSLYLFLMRGFYALSDAKTPFKINLLENIINIILAIPFAMLWGVKGLALAFALAYCFSVFVAVKALNHKIAGRLCFDEGFINYFAKILLSVSTMALIVSSSLYLLSTAPDWVQTLISVIAGGGVYAVMVLRMKLVDIHSLRKA